jgi:hypothetical protein
VIRYAVFFVLALVALVGLSLLIRPLIFTFAPPRDDSVYAVAAVAEIGEKPVIKDLVLNESHGLPGERPNGAHRAITVVISRSLAGGFRVLNAWSPASGCAVSVRDDRLADCQGRAWTFEGDPFVSSDRALQSFPTVVRNGAVVCDFTRPVDAGS